MKQHYPLIYQAKKVKHVTCTNMRPLLISALLSLVALPGCNSGSDSVAADKTEQEVIVVSDTTPPVITLNGETVVNHTLGDVYIELGASVTDDVDNNLTVAVTGEADLDNVGAYTITYTATDSAGNGTTVTRTINVISAVVDDDADVVVGDDPVVDDGTDIDDTVVDDGTDIDDDSDSTIVDENLCDATVPVGLGANMEAALVFAESRYTDLVEEITKRNKKYISYTDTSGVWESQGSSNWASGFLPGTLWYLYGLTGKESWKTAAEESTSGLESRATSTDNDTGFQIYGSYGIGRKMLGGTWDVADSLIDIAANTLVDERYNTNVGAFRAWPQSEDDAYNISIGDEFEVNVDMIMNMEVILSSAEKTTNTEHIDAAISHADIAWQHLMREDFSSYHVAGFNADGSLSYNRTHQGWEDESTWSRGQSWAVYGYAMLYQYTGLQRMLERSENAYQYFKQATQTQSENWISYADFDANVDSHNPLDTSASAVVASAALSLYEITGQTKYLRDANDIINELIAGYLSEGTDFDSLLIAGSEKYGEDEVGTSFGDFYFIEALYRLKHANAPSCDD